MSGVDVVARSLARSAAVKAVTASTGSPVYNRAGLAAWHTALANRTAAPAKVVWLGDSITEGVSVGTYGQRWVDKALARLRLDHPTPGVAGGFNFLPPLSAAASAGAGTPQPYTALTGGALGNDSGRGLSGRCAIFNSVGDGMTYSFTGTSCTAIYDKAPGLGTLSMAIDGGAAITVSTVGTNGTNGVLASGALAAGIHTVSITRSAGGAVYFSGLMTFNGDEAAGVQGFEGGHYGWSSSNFATSDPSFWMAMERMAPQLVVLTVGANDYAGQVAAATFRANLIAAIAGIRTVAPAASIALIAYSRRGDLAVQPIGWNQYVRTLYDVADADTGGINGASGVAVIDLSARLPNAATSGMVDPLGVYAGDRVHFVAKGHQVIGEAVGRALAL